MKKREKILLMLTLLAVVYGLVNFFILPEKKNTRQSRGSAADTNKITADFAMDSMADISTIKAQGGKNHWQALISKIESKWENDPFVLSLDPDALDEASSLASFPRFIYSGYMNVGKISFAVINGKEYKIGETIDEYEYQVIKITPGKVVLQKDTDQAVIFLKEE